MVRLARCLCGMAHLAYRREVAALKEWPAFIPGHYVIHHCCRSIAARLAQGIVS